MCVLHELLSLGAYVILQKGVNGTVGSGVGLSPSLEEIKLQFESYCAGCNGQ